MKFEEGLLSEVQTVSYGAVEAIVIQWFGFLNKFRAKKDNVRLKV